MGSGRQCAGGLTLVVAVGQYQYVDVRIVSGRDVVDRIPNHEAMLWCDIELGAGKEQRQGVGFLFLAAIPADDHLKVGSQLGLLEDHRSEERRVGKEARAWGG